MGWKKQHYTQEQKKKRFYSGNSLKIGRDGFDKSLDGFVFRPHFFEGYRNRVLNDPFSEYRTDEEIMAIAVHSFRESELPKKLSLFDNFNLLVNFHAHEGDIETPYGLFVVPLTRDRFDRVSGKICALTVLEAEERMEYIRGKLS